MPALNDVVFLLDVDNTLLDNDRLRVDLMRHLADEFGVPSRDRYAAILEALRIEVGYVDYLGAMQRYRMNDMDDPRLLLMASFLMNYPFADLLYPRALAAIAHLRQWGKTVILSDGDVVFQPHKIQQSGIWQAVEGRVLIYIHKEQMLDAVAARYPAQRYVMVDDKLRILAAMKKSWGERLITIFPRQGHYALDAGNIAKYAPADIAIEHIGDLIEFDFSAAVATNHNGIKLSTPIFSNKAPMKATTQLRKLGQSLWLDNISRDLLDSGTLKTYIDEFSVTGLTSNPTIFDQAIRSTTAYDDAIHKKVKDGQSGEALFFELAIEDLSRAAHLFSAVHEATGGVDGWVSLEVSPLLVHSAAGTIKEAARLHTLADCANLFIKIPGTSEGDIAIEESIFAGVPINVTLLFSNEQYVDAAEAYIRGIERRIKAGLDPKIASVASIFVSRWDAAVKDEVSPQYHNRLGIAMAMRIYKTYRDIFAGARWQALVKAGARPQRLLWASTGTKDPAAADTLYVEALASADTINTLPEKTLKAFANHGGVHTVLPADGGYAEVVLEEFRREGVDVAALAQKLQDDGAESFRKSWDALLTRIAEKSAQLTSKARI